MNDDNDDQGDALVPAPATHSQAHQVARAEARQAVADQIGEPAPVLAGTFAVYQTPDGGVLLVTDIPGRGIEKRAVPGKVIRLATTGVGAKMFGNLFGGGG